jgi:hypothetical protein
MAIHIPINSCSCYGDVLACPKCKPEQSDLGYLHLGKVICEKETVQLRYHCKICNKDSWLCLEQDQGNTFVYWVEQ